ncbi:hypothetical protein H5410_052972 [Solanum commersonii]|uniref:Uncharacterized protein n=1 Tax=Solanum commersonii TaxID=4109 RepID=A0A9J5X294_SOLCO|nr:hypothetical protein H5410_052972 [Solanum commersonii]
MEPIVPDGQNGSFSRSNDPRSRPKLWSQLSLMTKTSHLQGQTNLEAALTAKTTHFHVQTTPGAGKPLILPISCAIDHGFLVIRIPTSFFENFSWTYVKNLAMEPVVPDGQNGLFSRSNDPRSKNFSWMSFKTLAMELAVPNGQNGPFSRSNKTRSSQLALTVKTAHFQGQTIPGADLSYGASCPDGQNESFSRSNEPRSKLWIRLALMAKMTHFQGQTIPGVELRRHFCQNFSWTSVKILAMEPVVPDGQNSPFSRSNNPRTMEPVVLNGQNGQFSKSNEPRSSELALMAKTAYSQRSNESRSR